MILGLIGVVLDNVCVVAVYLLRFFDSFILRVLL